MFKLFKKKWQLFLMLFFPIVHIIIFSYIPMAGLLVAFQDFSYRKGFFGSEFVGFKYFMQFLSTPSFFSTIMSNTVILSLYGLIAGFPIPIMLAILLNEVSNKHFKKSVQMVTFAPYFISLPVMVGMLILFLNPNYGLVNNIITSLGGTKTDFMLNPNSFRHLYVWTGIWQGAGYSSVLYIAALSGVDSQLIDASVIDGANRWQKIWNIDIPTIRPTIIVVLILSLGGIMNIGFDKVLLMQNPINLLKSEVIATIVYKRGLINNEVSYATAVGVFNSVINLLLLVITNKIARHVTNESLW